MHVSEPTSSFLFQAEDLELAASPLQGRRHQVALRVGDRVALRGPSGAGKSSLLRALIALSPFQEGRLTVEGRSFHDLGPAAFRCRVIAVPQAGSRPTGQVADWVAALEGMRGPEARPAQGWSRMAVTLDLPGDLDRRACEDLSQGEWQRLLVALALSFDPAVLLLDEPFAALDAPRVRRMVELLVGWTQEGSRALFVASHEEPAWEEAAARAIGIQDGVLVEQGS